MSDHDVAVERDGQYGEHGDGQQAVAHEREQDAQGVAVQPGPFVEQRRGQRQVEAAEHQVRHRQVDDEHGRRVPSLNQNKKPSLRFPSSPLTKKASKSDEWPLQKRYPSRRH